MGHEFRPIGQNQGTQGQGQDMHPGLPEVVSRTDFGTESPGLKGLPHTKATCKADPRKCNEAFHPPRVGKIVSFEKPKP